MVSDQTLQAAEAQGWMVFRDVDEVTVWCPDLWDDGFLPEDVTLTDRTEDGRLLFILICSDHGDFIGVSNN